MTARIWYDGQLVNEMPIEKKEELGRKINQSSMNVLGYKKIPQQSGNSNRGK